MASTQRIPVFFNFANRGTKYGKRKQQDSPLTGSFDDVHLRDIHARILLEAYMFPFSRVLCERMSSLGTVTSGSVFLLYGVYRLYRQVKATDRDNE